MNKASTQEKIILEILNRNRLEITRRVRMNKANRATTSQKSKTGSVYEMYLENVGAGGVSQVHNYARDLTLMSPISVSLIDQKSGRWLVGFDSKISKIEKYTY